MANRIVKVILRGEIGDLRAKMTAAGKAVGDVADRMTAAGKEGEKFRRGLDELGGVAGRIGLVAAAGLGTIVVATANFEQAMSNVQAATHESTQNMERLREAAIQAGADTAFSASEAAAGIENLAKAGVSTGDILGGGLQGALDLAAAGSLDVAAAAEAAATAMTQFGLTGSDVPHIADLLAAAAGKAQGEVSDMNFALAQSGLVANQVGLSIEETAGGLAAFASAGLLGSDAGTSFKTMLGALTPNSDKAAEAMSKLGISAYDTQGNFVGLAEFAGNLRTALQDMTSEQRQATLETIFGSDAVRAASVLYDQGEQGIRDWIAAVDDQGYAAETAAIKMDNLKGDVEALGGSLETAFIGMGEDSQGPLRSLVQGLTNVVNAFSGLPPTAQSTVTALLGITAVTGGAAWFGSKVIRGIADTREALSNLGVTAGQSKAALAGIGKGLRVAALLAAISVVDNALDDLFDQTIDQSNLGRSLEALASGQITGEVARVFGRDLGQLATDIKRLDNFAGLAFTDKIIDWVPGFESGTEKAAARIRDVDSALAALVESGQAEQAAEQFQALSEAAIEGGASAEQIAAAFEQYQIAVDNATPTNNIMASSLGFLGDAWTDAVGKTEAGAKAAEAAAKKQADAAEAAKRVKDEIREQAEAWGGLGDSVGDAETSLQDWIDSLENRATAIRNFSDNIRNMSGRLLPGLLQSFVEAGEGGALRLEQLANASETEIARANDAWRSQRSAIKDNQDAVADFREEVEEANRKKLKEKEAKVKTREAIKRVNDLIHLLKDIPDQRVNVFIDYRTGKRPEGVLPGSTLGGVPTFATGGWTGPGAKYQPAGVVHADEFVFSKEATQGNVAMLDVLHRQLRGYAAGGFVGTRPSMGGGFGIDYDRLAAAVASDHLMGYRNNRDALLSAMRTALSELPIVQAPRDPLLLHGAL